MKLDQKLITVAASSVSKADSSLKIVNQLLVKRDLYALLFDPARIRKAIELTVNASLHLDPYYDPFQLQDINIDDKVQAIETLIRQEEPQFTQKRIFTIPKTPTESRKAVIPDVDHYILRYLLCIILAERISFNEFIYGGKADIFELTPTDKYKSISEAFNRRQLELLDEPCYTHLVYVDIAQFYDMIEPSLLLDHLSSILSVEPSDPFVILSQKVLKNISLSYRCDHFLQNLFLQQLDLALDGYDWAYVRLTDDIRIFTKTETEAELAYTIIKTVLSTLKLKINYNKCFVLHPIADLADHNQHGAYGIRDKNRRSAIISLAELEQYPIENYFRLCSNSMSQFPWAEYRYETKHPKSLTYKDEVNGLIGFENETAILIDFQSASVPDEEAFRQVLTLLFAARGNYRFQYDTIYAVIVKAINLTTDEADNRLSVLFNYLDQEIKGGSSIYSLYLFLRIWFIDLREHKDILKLKQSPKRGKILKGIYELIFKFICGYTYEQEYLALLIKYIFKNELLGHQTPGKSSFNTPEFWAQQITAFQDKNPANWEYKQAGSMIMFFENWFIENSTFQIFRARLPFKKRNYREARDFYKQAEKDDPIFRPYLFELAYCYAELNELENALIYYDKYLQYFDAAGAYNNRALVYEDLNRLNEAISDLSKAIALDPDRLYYTNRAHIYAQLGSYKPAINDITTAINLADFNAAMHYELFRARANYHMLAGQREKALNDIKDYYSYGPDFTYDTLEKSIEKLIKGIQI